MKKIIPVLALVILALILNFFKPQQTIVKPTDYEQYLDIQHLSKAQETISKQIEFWQKKLALNSNNHVYQKKLADLYAKTFKLTGDIELLHQSDSLLSNINDRIPGQVGVLQSLALNAITRHSFKEADSYISEAYAIGEQKFVSTLIKTDVLLERGQFLQAQQLMRDIASKEHFDYLIRAVKLQDQEGALKEAIRSMEKAAILAKASGNTSLINWSLSNLGDMYGHDGRINKSYQAYLEALSYEPADLHSLKGIAWIAFSNDKNTAESSRILSFLKRIHPTPDYDLLLAELATFEGNLQKAKQYEKAFITKASSPEYRNMYKGYLCLLNADGESTATTAIKIAQEEIRERPHPMSYHLLAWSTFKKGYHGAALDILNRYVVGQTEEPEALYHTGIIFKENGYKKEARKYLKLALDASFELGPLVTQDIKQHLKQLNTSTGHRPFNTST